MHPIDTGEMNASSERKEATPNPNYQQKASSIKLREDTPRNHKSNDHGKTSKSYCSI